MKKNVGRIFVFFGIVLFLFAAGYSDSGGKLSDVVKFAVTGCASISVGMAMLQSEILAAEYAQECADAAEKYKNHLARQFDDCWAKYFTEGKSNV